LASVPLISIIDDDESVREATASLVRSFGYATATYAGAEDYLNSNRVANTACVITDLQMPGLSGVDLQVRMVANGHRVPVIIVTAFPDDATRKRALDNGASAFLSKPIDEDKLIASLDNVLNR
jgi:FixJ family two-component response regulator